MNYSVKVFTMPDCSSCIALKKWLNKEEINFTERDIINDEEAKNDFLAKDLKFTPHSFIEVDGQVHEIIGFNTDEIKLLLRSEL